MFSSAPVQGLFSLVLLINTGGVLAQTEPPVDPRKPDAVERAKRENEKIYKWIKLQIDPPKRAPETKPAQAAAAPVTPKPAVSPARAEATAKAPVAARKDNATTAAGTSDGATKADAVSQTAPAAVGLSAEAVSAPANPTAMNPAEAAQKPQPPAGAEPEIDSELVLIQQVEPDYPPALRRQLRRGSVQVRFEVQPDGSVVQPEVVKTSHPRLNAAALRAVAQWKFQPLHRTEYAIVELNFDSD